APGPVASIAFSPDQPLRTLDLSLAGSDDPTGAAFRVNVDRVANSERASVTVSTDISRLTAHAVDAKGADIRTSLDLHADAHGALHDEPQPPNSIGTKLSTVAGDLARHADHAMQVFGRPPASAASTVDASWNLRLRNAAEGTPLLRVDGGKADLDAAADPATITWRRSNETESSTLSATGTLGAGVTVHDDHLVLDADAPLQLGVALGSQPRRRTDTELALLVAFSDALKPAPATSSGLWDAEYYSRFWSNYTATRAGRARSPLFDSPRIVAGPISVRQITGPVAPLRIAVGHGERLELHAPFSARALFGTANGLVESAVGWRADQASLDSRFTLQLGNIQAGAVGLDLDDGHVPLVEDELDADLAVRTDGLALTREMIARAAAFESPVGLDRIGLALQLHKSARSQAVPGVLQLSTDMQVNTLNKILNIIASDLQMTVPPQTMTYRNIDVNVRVDRGVVTTATPWLTLDGAQILSDPHLALEGTVRLYGGRNGGTLTLDDLLALFIHQ
ncbi:MAG: hypothetical protein LAO77_23900, partial [Acidobacteriia bacterium]|nr:hypothetical protein [Terriglobia bacterium]